MEKRCRVCNLILDTTNSVIVKKKYTRSICRKCRSASVVEYDRNRAPEKRKYANEYARRIGKVKEYPCEQCGKLCYKKYAKAFCSDQCRFLSYVEITDTCWLWTGGLKRRGYGKFSMIPIKSMPAHRASYILFKGEIPEGKCICHQCDNPRCVKPEHLWVGTTQENTQDMVNKGRSLRGEKQNLAKLTKEDVLKIRELGSQGMVQWKIGEMFNLTAGHVNNIIKRRAWQHV